MSNFSTPLTLYYNYYKIVNIEIIYTTNNIYSTIFMEVFFMFLVNKKENKAISLPKKSFKELGFKERKHLQEWICKNPDMLGESLLIIQKEFSGFDDTKERLDLLAIDENGNIVVIENKLDDSGRDVVWQSLKYVSYCSGLLKSDIKEIYQQYLSSQSNVENAEQNICDFLGSDDFDEIELNKGDQRIILVAASFRKEVTSTVMWLLDHNIKIKCIKVTPFIHGDNTFIDIEQIIPIKDAEEYQIKLANKKQEELITKEKNQTANKVRYDFWTRLLQEMNKKSDLFSNISPSKDNWIGCGSGHSGLLYNHVITRSYARVELWINKGSAEVNKQIFDNIHEHKEQIESLFGNSLDWQRLDNGKGSRIAYYLRDVNVFNEDDWDRMIDFMIPNMILFKKAMKDVLNKVMRK